MQHNGKTVSKRITEQHVIEALGNWPGCKLVKINWKKRKVHIVDGFGNKKVLSLPI